MIDDPGTTPDSNGEPSPTASRGLLEGDHLWSFLAILAILAIVLTQFGVRRYEYAPGDITAADIVAPVDLRVPDPETTERRRREAMAAIADVYDFDPFAWRESVDSWNTLFGWAREQIGSEVASWESLGQERREALEAEASAVFGLRLPDDFVELLWDEGFTAETELEAERLLRGALQHSLLGSTEALPLDRTPVIVVRDISNQEEEELSDLGLITDLQSARSRIEREAAETLTLEADTEAVIGSALAALLRPNLTYNSNETQMRRQAAAAAVDTAFYELKRGRTILREGDPVTETSLRELQALQEQWQGGGTRRPAGGLLLLVAVAVFSLWRYARHDQRRQGAGRVRNLYELLLLLLVAGVLMTRAGVFVGDAVAGAMTDPPLNVAEAYRFAIPFAVGPLIVVLLADSGSAWVYAAVQAAVVGVVTGDATLALYGMLSSFAAVWSMSRYAQRTEMLRTGATVGATNVILVVGYALLAEPTLPWTLILFEAALGAFGGFQVALVASAVLPLLEQLFNTLTDVKLLELSNMNLPLLKQLAVRSPGTYHHSVVIGTLAEKAAEAIGANPLFTRVAAYYHDIGKMRHPEFFVENQKEGYNPHDRMSPAVSARVLLAHVVDGLELAREHRLPEPLADVIPQHHGTRVMKYFYERARGQAADGEVPEEDFRYPGPKPQTKEAALIMLADGVEARSRLIEEPTSERLQDMVQRNIREVLEDGQLDECELTLQDLAKISEAFLAVLAGMHHQRIEYPEEAMTVPETESLHTSP